MQLNGIDLSRFQIAKGDTLFSPAFTENDSNLMQFDYIAMNQPFGLKLNNTMIPMVVLVAEWEKW